MNNMVYLAVIIFASSLLLISMQGALAQEQQLEDLSDDIFILSGIQE